MPRTTIKNIMLLLAITLMTIACTVTGPADDGFERDDEWVDNGRLSTTDLGNLFKNRKAQESKIDTTIAVGNSTPRKNDPGYADYQAYREWHEARANNGAEYRKFLKWQEFQEYQRWKARQQ